MAVKIEYTQEQREAQGRIIARIFNLNGVENVTRDWSMESVNGGKARLRIELVAFIDMETANALANGCDDGSGGIS